MGDFPGPQQPALPLAIHTHSRFSGVWDIRAQVGAVTPGSATHGTANLIKFVPMFIPFHYPVNRWFWVNGSTASGNMAIGIYTVDGRRLVSLASTAQSGASAPQYVNAATPFVLAPGSYMFAQVCSGTTNAVWGSTTQGNEQMRFAGCKQLAGSTTLTSYDDASAWVAPTQGVVGLFGVTWTTSGF